MTSPAATTKDLSATADASSVSVVAHGRGTAAGGPRIAPVQFLPLTTIKPATENADLYNGFSLSNPDDLKLAQDIQADGILTPLHVSNDGVLLDGHRRYQAAVTLDMDGVPVIKSNLWFYALDMNERMRVLRRFNHQREKSFDERVAEAQVDIDPDEAYQAVISHRARRALIHTESNIDMGERRKRSEITTKAFLDAVLRIIEDARPNWPISNRAVHYRLLNDPPLTHDSKPKSYYRNDKAYSAKLSRLLTRARIEGLIPMEAIEDDERPVCSWKVYQQAADFILEQERDFLQGYARDLLQSQPHHIEIIVEKKTQFTATKNVAMNYTIPVTAGKGFVSLAPRWAIAQRYQRSRKNKLVLICLTDFDPDGEQIATSCARSLRDDFGVQNIHPVKAALTAEQVKRYDLPSDLEAKVASPNYRRFVDQHGTRAVELEALPDELYAHLLKDAIHGVLDIAAFNHEVEQERHESIQVAARRKAVINLITRGDATS